MARIPADDAMPKPDAASGQDEYLNLSYYANQRHRELSRMLAPFVEITDEYGTLVARIVWMLGALEPSDKQDRVVRDLLSDTFDFLTAWRRSLLEGQLAVAYPLARRGYESLSLLSVCLQDPAFAARWEAGAQIGNAEVRTALGKLPFKEAPDSLRDVYKFFSKAAHPNRDLVPYRYIGAGNKFALGSIGQPDLVFVVDHCIHLLSMWYWFVAALGYYYREPMSQHDKAFGQDYLATAEQAQKIGAWLAGEFNRLLAQVQQSGPPSSSPGAA